MMLARYISVRTVGVNFKWFSHPFKNLEFKNDVIYISVLLLSNQCSD